LLNKHLSLYKY